MNKQLTRAEIDALPIEERLLLIEELWDSLTPEAEDLALPDWHAAELDKRLDALESGHSIGTPWSEVRTRIATKR